jgi:hypothetical protein
MSLVCQKAFAAQVTLAWDANNDSSVTGYKLYWGISSRAYTYSLDVKNVTQYTLPSVPEGFNLFFAVTAYNTNNQESAYSVELPAFTLVPTGVGLGVIDPYQAVVVSTNMTKTFTITPINRYHIRDVQVDGVSVGQVTSYTFTGVTKTHTLKAFFDPDTALPLVVNLKIIR